MKSKIRKREFDPPDFTLSWLRRNRMWRVVDRHGFVGILRKGERAGYLVSHKLWRTGVLDSESFTGIMSHGKLIAYFVPASVWEFWLSFIGSFTPAGRRRLPQIAACAARRDAEEEKRRLHCRQANQG